MELENIKTIITRQVLFNKFSQEQIMEFYFGEPVKLKKAYKNFSRNDKSATCYFFYKRSGELVFMDFGLGKWINCLDMASLRNGGEISYRQVYEQMSNITPSKLPIPTITFDKDDTQSTTTIKVEVMPYEAADLAFWNQFNISLEILKHFNVRKVKRAWTNGQLTYINVDRDPCYRYIENDRIKLYRPKNKKMKFRNNYIQEFEGTTVLPQQGDTLVITKSMKDIMTLYSIGITAVSPRSESAILDSVLLSDFLKAYKKVVLWYDADTTGEERSAKMYEMYKDQGLKRVTHDPILGKDVSDIVKTHGINKLIELCKQLEIL